MSCSARPEASVQVAEERSDSRPVMDGSLEAEQDIAKCNRLARMSIDKADSQWVPGHIDAGYCNRHPSVIVFELMGAEPVRFR